MSAVPITTLILAGIGALAGVIQHMKFLCNSKTCSCDVEPELQTGDQAAEKIPALPKKPA